MPVHGQHSLESDQDAFLQQRLAIEEMLQEDPTFLKAMPGGGKSLYSPEEYRQIYWQVESDGSTWPTIDAIMWGVERRTGHLLAVYNSGREACMAALGCPEGFRRG